MSLKGQGFLVVEMLKEMVSGLVERGMLDRRLFPEYLCVKTERLDCRGK